MCITKIIQSCLIEVLFNQFNSLYENISKNLKSSQIKCHFHLLEALLSLVLSVQEKVPLLVGESVIIGDEGSLLTSEIEPLNSPLPGIILGLIKNSDPKVRKILIDLVYSLYSLVPDCMTNYSLSFWNMLKETKTDKNKFVREASLACLKKFGDILKESPEVRETLKGGKGGAKKGKRTNIKKKGKNKAFFNKQDDEDEPAQREKNSQKRRGRKKMEKHSSKELIVKGNPGMHGSNSGRLEGAGGNRAQGKGDSKMRGKIINKKMNLKNVKGRLNIQKLKKEFAKKKQAEKKEKIDDEIEIAFKEPAEKIDYEKWMNEEQPEVTTVEPKTRRPRPKRPQKKKPSPPREQPEPEEPDTENMGFEINIAVPAGPNPYAKKEKKVEEIPDQFSDEASEENAKPEPTMRSQNSRIADKRRELQAQLKHSRDISPRRRMAGRGDYTSQRNPPMNAWQGMKREEMRIGTGHAEYRSDFRKSSAWNERRGADANPEEINKFKTYVKLLNKRIKEMNQEMKGLREENKFMKKRLDHLESMLFMINTTLINGNIMSNQMARQTMPNANLMALGSTMPIKQGTLERTENVSSNMLKSPQRESQKERTGKASVKPKKLTPSKAEAKNFDKKRGVITIVEEPGDKPIPVDPYKNDYMSPIEQNNFNFKEDTANLAQEFMLSKEPSQIKKSWNKTTSKENTKPESVSEDEVLRLETMIREAEAGEESPASNGESINNLIFEIMSSPVSKDQLKDKYIWGRFLESEGLLEMIVLLEKTILLRLIAKLIDLEITAQLHNDMDLLAMIFRWVFELVCLPQFEEELFTFLDSDLFKRENRYFDDSQLDMSEICVNSTDISSIIRDNRLKIGFKVWKTTIFTISAYENEEIMEHCHKIISFMRQKSIGSERTNAMTDITEEANVKGKSDQTWRVRSMATLTREKETCFRERAKAPMIQSSLARNKSSNLKPLLR